MRPATRAGALAALLLLAAGCGEAAPPPAQQSAGAASPPAADTLRLEERCANPTDGYALSYPAGWQVNRGDVLPPCSLFDPEEIRVPRDSELPIEIGVAVDVEPVPFTRVSGETLGRRVVQREAAEIAGRPAVRLLSETTGEGLHPRGIRTYQVMVDLGGRTLAATAYEAGALPLEHKRRVVDAMMESLELLPPGA